MLALDKAQPAGGGEQLCLRVRADGWGWRTSAQTCFDWLVGLFDGWPWVASGAVRVIGGCGKATDTLYMNCVGTPSATTT